MARSPHVPLLIALLLCAGGLSRAETYDYVVDRFEVDGNVNGPFDGVVDHVDEFDDGVLAPWFFRRGSASTESGGLLHVKSPGLHIDIPGIFTVPFEASAVGVDNRLHVGNGDATSHEAFQSDRRRAWHGLALAVIRAGDRPGEVRLRALAERLDAADVTLQVR